MTDASTTAGLTESQLRFFRTFGFIKLPGFYADEIAQISEGFDEVFAATAEPFVYGDDFHLTEHEGYGDKPRMIIPKIVDQTPKLSWLRDDPRLRAIVESILGTDVTYMESDGNLFHCDVHWHVDTFGTTNDLENIKVYFYLDHLTSESGALRMVPGSAFPTDTFAKTVGAGLYTPERCRETFGVEPDEIPAVPIDIVPGDLLIGRYTTWHASFGGNPNRRLFTMNFQATNPGFTEDPLRRG